VEFVGICGPVILSDTGTSPHQKSLLLTAKVCQSEPAMRKLTTKGMINSELPVVFRHQAQVLGGQLSYSDRHMVLPVETSGRLGMG